MYVMLINILNDTPLMYVILINILNHTPLMNVMLINILTDQTFPLTYNLCKL